MPVLVWKKYKGKRKAYIGENKTKNGERNFNYLLPLGVISAAQARHELAKYNYEHRDRDRLHRRTFADSLEEFQMLYKARVKPSMYKLFCSYLFNISQEFREKLINGVAPIDIQALQTKMKQRGVSGRTINIFSTQLKKVFVYAKEAGYLRDLPTFQRFPESIPTRKTLRLSNAQLLTLRKNADSDEKFALIFLNNTGLRCFEFVNLKIEHIDLEKRYVHVESDNPLKSGRIVPMTRKLRRVLKVTWPKIIARGKICPWETRAGVYLSLKKLGKRCLGFPGTPKQLRKTFGSRLAESGISRIAHMRIMGHSNYKTTDKYYIDIDQSYLSSELEKVKKL